jgi:hypothetical protein
MLTMRDEERKVLTASNDVARCKFFWGGVGTPSENINITKIVTIETNSKTEQQNKYQSSNTAVLWRRGSIPTGGLECRRKPHPYAYYYILILVVLV